MLCVLVFGVGGHYQCLCLRFFQCHVQLGYMAQCIVNLIVRFGAFWIWQRRFWLS